MKIEWLNEARTMAKVTRGLFRKRVAIVYRWDRTHGFWTFGSYAERDDNCSMWLEWRLNRARRRSHWTHQAQLPEARVVRGME